MAILASLFGGNKKDRPASTSLPTSPQAPDDDPRPAKPARLGSSSRFASIRRGSSFALSDEPKRPESHRRASSAVSAQSASKAALPVWTLPDFEFGGGKGKGKDESRGLGLDDMGKIPTLTEAEIACLDQLQSLSVDAVCTAWTVLGPIVGRTDRPLVILDLPPHDSQKQRRVLIAFLYLSVQPSSLASFPSVAASYPVPKGLDEGKLWKERLADLARLSEASNVGAALKWATRRLSVSPPLPDHGVSSKMTVDRHDRFAEAERLASYPINAYTDLFAPTIPPETARMLHALFEAWASLTAHAEVDSMLGGKICLLFGWWILQCRVSSDEGWRALYEQWRDSALRLQHLVYAWLRSQSSVEKLPTRLQDLVAGYPFFTTNNASTYPSPPPSSYNRSTLHVSLICDKPLRTLLATPNAVLQAALQARVMGVTELPAWRTIKLRAEADGASQAASVVDERSGRFLDAASGSSAPAPSAPSTVFRSHSRTLDVLSEEVGQMASQHQGPRAIARKQSRPALAALSLPRSESTWEDFTKQGFLEDGATVDLALSPTEMTTSPMSDLHKSHIRDVVRSESGPNGIITEETRVVPPPRIDADLSATSEKIIEVDDLFINFVEEGQLDPSTTATWPRFALFRLHPDCHSLGSSSVEQLLISITYQAPAPSAPASPEPTVVRSASPSAESTTTITRLGSFGFGRKSISDAAGKSTGGGRKSLFGIQRSSSKDSRAALLGLGSLASSRKLSLFDTDRPLGEMISSPLEATAPPLGATVPVSASNGSPSTPVPTSASVPFPTSTPSSDPATPTPNGIPVVATSEAPSRLPRGISTGTRPQDWTYAAEGGAHVVFTFNGTNSSYTGKIIRVRKLSQGKEGEPPTEASVEWRDNLLPRLVPPHLLVHGDKEEIESDWIRELCLSADDHRPVERKSHVPRLVDDFPPRPAAFVMENMRGEGRAVGSEKMLAIEIKPKWGFLPSAEFIQPPEAAAIKSTISRYTLHQHYRGRSTGQAVAYEPLDLFSGDEKRMSKAWSGLWESWRETEGKGNNLRVFVDGRQLGADDIDLLPGAKTGASLPDLTGPLILPLLAESDIFPLLSALQSSLDPTDISDLCARYRAVLPHEELFTRFHTPDIAPQEYTAFIDKYLADPSAGRRPDGWTNRERIIAYSLSAIFKDCSIMVRATLHRQGNEQPGKWVVVDGSAKVKMLDLDLKPLKMRHWAELDEKIWRHWMETKGLPAHTSDADDAEKDARVVAIPSATPGTDVNGTMDPTPEYLTPKGKVIPRLLNLPRDNDSTRALYIPTPRAGTPPVQSDATNAAAPLTPGVEMSLEDALGLSPLGKRGTAPLPSLESPSRASPGSAPARPPRRKISDIALDTTALHQRAVIPLNPEVEHGTRAAGAGPQQNGPHDTLHPAAAGGSATSPASEQSRLYETPAESMVNLQGRTSSLAPDRDQSDAADGDREETTSIRSELENRPDDEYLGKRRDTMPIVSIYEPAPGLGEEDSNPPSSDLMPLPDSRAGLVGDAGISLGAPIVARRE